MNQKGKPYSIDEMKFMSMLEKGVRKREDGHYEMPLPLKSKEMSLPYNKPLAIKRWNQLTARFRKNQKFQEDYTEFMKGVIADHAERVPTDRLNAQDRVNYIPHTGVYHPRKPDKIRVVFDCSAAYQGVSLNDHLLQGPNSMNSLLGVLCRFRKEEVACAVDVKSMFHQFFVSPEDRDLLRFLWWEDGKPGKQQVHPVQPPSAYERQQRMEDEFGADAAEFIRKDFYVDDGLTSVPSTQIAVKLLKDSQGICAKAGLKLHKVISNDIDVLKSFPKEDRSKEVQQLDLDKDSLSLERVLGVVWRIQNDVFNFIVEIKERPFTRRGVLSTVSSFYDPCGFISPVMLPGKRILQEMCRSNADWDTPMPEALRARWENWLEDVRNLEGLQIPRCLKPNGFGKIKQVELHHFSDASEDGYGQCTYVRFINEDDNVHCALVIGKSRVTPLRQITIPRLELAAATTSARMSSFVKEELKYHDAKDFFWTDNPKDWFYVDTRDNPADEASRGMSAKQLTHDSRWLRGPEFLWRNPTHQAEQTDAYQLMEGDPEVRRANVMSTQATAANTKYPDQFKSSRLEPFSSWYRAKKAIARCFATQGPTSKKGSQAIFIIKPRK
ncbi:uncharacterized protein LOC115921808 [Strongylocentrotus purpuratus]|uniref:Uncharacterized protein n=1 Tax=Strongylocentrotus purpuratus TaxID=7668 RepID=A0A7M7NFH0_STRPU|nr:uncharacterized protein LOC115921808 [Strongylocentrotus purpuratus]